ncbi:carbon-nitrogen family hydrolase [Citricoccus nitrophenolicus]|uniref:carbon-nitrogen family hydrolase n=1 Tax=Citricoccus nitrophenolicus TaxID=863575 RepID=UPI0039B3EA7E
MKVWDSSPSSGQLEVAAVQVKFDSAESPEGRISRVEDLMSDVVDADLIVLPELWFHGAFSFDSWRQNAVTLDSSVLSRLSKVARDQEVWLHAGSFVQTVHTNSDSDMWNTSVLFDASGTQHTTYKKIHRFGFTEGEPTLVEAGDEPVTAVVQTDTGTAVTGLTTCYDLRFPELYRYMLKAGTALHVVPAAWPLSRVPHWEVLGRARAIENQAYVVQCNMAGMDHQTEYGGHSQIVDPNGEILAQAGVEEAVIQARLDFDRLAEVRRSFPVLQDQRADIWSIRDQSMGNVIK